MGEDFCYHFRVFDGNRQTLLADAFPIHPAETGILGYGFIVENTLIYRMQSTDFFSTK